MMNLDDYLKRLKCDQIREVSLENLKKLQKAHLCEWAFENLDMHMGKHIEFSFEKAYNKLMNKQRGGYCLELNTVFAWALKKLGYDIYLTNAFS